LIFRFYGLVFISLGLIKILLGYNRNTILLENTHYIFSFFEIVLGLLFWTKFRDFAFLGAILFFFGSILVPFIFKYEGCGCGCFGRAFLLDKRSHLIISSLLGFLFSLTWLLSKPKNVREKEA